MKIKKEMLAVCAAEGVRAGGYQATWEELHALGIAHSVGAVVRDFEKWLEEFKGDDFRQGAAQAYLYAAPGRLSGDTSSPSATFKAPEVVSLTRELTYASGGQISFMDKQKARLAEVLAEFSADEIISVFKTWYADQDTSDAKNLGFLPGKFVQQADGLAYSARKLRQEADLQKTQRDAAAKRLQEEAAAEREADEAKKKLEENFFDPLA